MCCTGLRQSVVYSNQCSLFTRERGSPKDCNNYRGISFLSTPGKVFAMVLLNTVRDQLLAHHRVEQSGFTPGR